MWTFKFFETAVNQVRALGENEGGIYLAPPDLFVRELSRDCIEMDITELLNQGNLEDLLNSSILIEKE